MKTTLILAATLLLLAGCSQHPPADEVKTLHYTCGTLPLTVQLNNSKQQVSLILNGTPLTLQQQPVASGTRYSDGQYTFWSKGNGAFILRDDTIIINDCLLASAG